MKLSSPRTLALAPAILGLLTTGLQAQEPKAVPPALDAALQLKGGRIVAFQPVQMKSGQTLVVTQTTFSKKKIRPGQGALLVVYSTDAETYGNVLHQEVFIREAGPGGGPHVKVFSGFSPQADQEGIIAILIGLLLPAVNADAQVFPLPAFDGVSAEIHSPNSGAALLLPAVQKVRDAAAR